MRFGQKNSFSLACDAFINSFYMDNCIASVPTLDGAQSVLEKTRESIKIDSFRLTKFLSNNKLALQNNPCKDHNEIKTPTCVLQRN